MPTYDLAALFAAATPEDRDTCATTFAASVKADDLVRIAEGLNPSHCATSARRCASTGPPPACTSAAFRASAHPPFVLFSSNAANRPNRNRH